MEICFYQSGHSYFYLINGQHILKTKGCKIWGIDNNEYLDVSLMGVGTNILGYSHPEVDNAVRKVIDKGNMSTLIVQRRFISLKD